MFLWLTGFLLVFLLRQADALSGQRPYELVVYTSPHPSSRLRSCVSLYFRETQPHKGLPLDLGAYISHRLPSPLSPGGGYPRDPASQSEITKYLSFNKTLLWSKALDVCGHPSTWSQSIFLDENLVDDNIDLAKTQQVLTSPVPPSGSVIDRVPSLDIVPLILSGPSANRVDLVFFSDGYTLEERQKFMEDAQRLADDISSNHTFNTVKPLLNFWAAFTPSNESGIGTGGKPKDTPFGLYRDGTELRGVYYSKPDQARAACFSMGDKCNYPILMGNDPLYGGLGGEFTVITPSLANGALVLRHELGHSIIEVGEEYDGGFAYFGPNAAPDVSAPLPWQQWLTYPPAPNSSPRIERSVMPLQNYAWTLLNTSSPWSIEFDSSGLYSRYVVRFSLSGVPEKEALDVEFDGGNLGWTPRKDIGVDRWHYDIRLNEPLPEGIHEVKFALKDKALEGTAQLCSVEIMEFGDETQFNATSGYYGAFPTFSEKNETTIRPTNEDCLMRQVTTPNFCKACLEGLWLSLLSRVNLIDEIHAGCIKAPESSSSGAWRRTINLKLVPLAEYRDETVDAKESYHITWSRAGKVLDQYTNKTTILVDDEVGVTYSTSVRFATEEVRVDEHGYLQSAQDFTLVSKCDV
ncbi:hypothetical protein JAAARDRAFT_29945 [Jaapia argillacea MUCL 33604]|uniref:IgA peptidase M64-domain-containing protein n=1 Tax=Jaapia argillacea MUCL 33604 TaxID=933084 RepID=A0A067QHG3_9AGAM|nr:hypothetical protein JAAARDRAFT_29945 [Jaapia argillacea MUCL 33604]